MNSRFYRSLKLSLAILDFLTINTVFFSVDIIFQKQLLITSNIEYAYFILYLNTTWITIALIKNIYHERYILSFERFTRVSMHAYTYLILVLMICLFFFRMMQLSRIFIVVVSVGIWVALLLNRSVYFVVYRYFKNKDWLVNKVVIIGYNNLSKKLANYLSTSAINKKVIGFCEEYENIYELSHFPILSNVSNALDVCKKYHVTEIYSTISPENNPSVYQLSQDADENCIRFKIVPDLAVFSKQKMHIDYLQEIPVISLRKEPLEDLDNRIKKRLFDIVISSLVTVFILSWLIPIIGLIIIFESKGPIFFVQYRTGRNNRKFACLKFRSMQKNDSANLQQASKDDTRITRIGRFLRRSSLDEFPQFLNVLKGDMSIVGPRPHMLKHTDQYSKVIGKYMVRQFLKPGITGWAQVNGFRGETQTIGQMQKRVEHDLWYIENWSFFLDLKIMVMTAFNTMKGEENAY